MSEYTELVERLRNHGSTRADSDPIFDDAADAIEALEAENARLHETNEVLRMKSLYEMATGENADEVAGRSLGEREAMLAAWLAEVDGTPVCDPVQVDQSEDAVHPGEQSPVDPDNSKIIATAAQRLVYSADARGLFVTIERRPLLPLAMGNTEAVVTVWKKRGGV